MESETDETSSHVNLTNFNWKMEGDKAVHSYSNHPPDILHPLQVCLPIAFITIALRCTHTGGRES